MFFSNRAADIAGAIVLVGVVCGAGGWLLGSGLGLGDGGGVTGVRLTFEARVESSADGGLTACLDPIDPIIRRDFGGSVCGRVYWTADADTSVGARVHVEWLSLTDDQTDEAIDTFVLEPSDRSWEQP